ncbi:MAG TPA: Ku protein [Bryobacteraceae bacterium]|jgi:DNA end-binding protein Ku
MAATVWKGFLSFGLVSFPVRLFSAARDETIHFHMLHKKDRSRLKEVWYCVEEDKPIQRSDIEKGYEVSKGEYVVVEDEELKKIAPATATTMDILQFVENDEVDPIYFDTSYYVAAEDKAAKPYVLFLAALTETKQDALAKIAMHTREHVALIRPSQSGLVLHTLYYPDELHKANRGEVPKATYSAKELELAKSLVNHLKAPFKPQEFKDEYRENVERLIEQKRKGQKITAVKQPRKAPVIDLMEALKRSLKSSSSTSPVETRRSAPPKKKAGRHKAA